MAAVAPPDGVAKSSSLGGLLDGVLDKLFGGVSVVTGTNAVSQQQAEADRTRQMLIVGGVVVVGLVLLLR